MMTVCRLCLVESNDVIHIFREVGVQLKVSSILSKHFGSLFEVTKEYDEAICSSCWTHTESFHTFYQSIKNAQNCYSSDEEDGGVIMSDSPHHQVQPQNVKLVMYDSVTGQVIEQRQQNDHHYHITYNNSALNNQRQQQQQHDQMHVIDQDSYEVCDETTDSDLELLMMMQPHDTSGGGGGGVHQQQQQHQQHIQQHHQDEQMSDHIIQIAEDDEEDRMDESTGMAPILHIRDRSNSQLHNEVDDSVSEFLQSNEHITVIEVSSASQAQKLLQQQQMQQQQQHMQQQQQIVQQPQIVVRPGATVKPRRPPVARKRKQQAEVNVITTTQQHNNPVVSTIVTRPAPVVTMAPELIVSPQKSSTSMVSTFANNPTPAAKTGEPSVAEPYRMQCDLCSKTFKTFHRVQSHYQLKHNMDGYVMCCGDQFFEKDLLVDHILMHVNNRRQMKKISCAYCDQFFYRKRFYTRHLLKVHNITATNGNSRNESLNSSTSSTTSPSTATTPVRATTASATINAPHTTTYTVSPGVQVVRQIGQPVRIIQKLAAAPLKTVISNSASVIKQEAHPSDELLILGS